MSASSLSSAALEAKPHAPAIAIDALSVVYGEGANAVRALDNVSLEIERGEFYTLLGPSGCGKTTLLRCIAGFELPTHGSIRLEGQVLDGLPPFKRPVNTVFQSYALFPHLTVAQNIAFGLEERRVPRAEIARTVERMLALVQLEGYGARRPAQLSGGQQQRVALARALAGKPKVLLLDESLSALDLKLRQEMRLELKRLQRETGITFVFVTHDQDEALTMSDRLAVMRAGRVAQEGTPAEIYDRPRSKYVADFIGDTNFLSGAVAGARLTVDASSGLRGSLPLPAGTVARTLTVAVRPERLRLLEGDDLERADLRGRVSAVVYMGSETVYQIGAALSSSGLGSSASSSGGSSGSGLNHSASSTGVRVRVPNALGAFAAFRVGDEVGIQVPAEGVQPLEDEA